MRNKKKIIPFSIAIAFALLTLLLSANVKAQYIDYAKKVTDTLCSPSMFGRGYVSKGDSIAADFIKNEFEKSGLKPIKNAWLQPFDISVNTFPGKIAVKIGEKTLIPGSDFMVSSSSPSHSGTYKTFYIDSTNASTVDGFKKIMLQNLSAKVVIIDTKGIYDKDILNLLNVVKTDNVFKSKALVYLSDKKPIWGLSECTEVQNWAVISALRKCFLPKSKKITIEIESKFVKKYSTSNVIASIKGSVKPDSFIVFTAHYDHLGKMGKDVYFPGANDNASGIAMLLSLAKYYALPENQQEYSIAFIATSAEEVGLLGSDFYSKNPFFPLKQIRFLINFDMVGTGDDGIKVVNATIFEKEFGILDGINKKDSLLKVISKRGEAAISDHYPFYAKGVKCFYIYTLGGISAYHVPEDKSATLPFTEFDDLFKLVTRFVSALI